MAISLRRVKILKPSFGFRRKISSTKHVESFIENNATTKKLSHFHWEAKSFANLIYTEPLYIKEFYSPQRKD